MKVRIAGIATATLSVICAATAIAGNGQPIATDLAFYPGLYDTVAASAPLDVTGRQCTRVVATSKDALPKVEAWYRKAWADATVSDVNKNALYGRHAKLNGIRLERGSEFMTIYRMTDQTTTSIELYKCEPLKAAVAKAQ